MLDLTNQFFSISELRDITISLRIAGIYCFYYNGTEIYVGKTVNVHERMRHHIMNYQQYCDYKNNPSAYKIVGTQWLLAHKNVQDVDGKFPIIVSCPRLYNFIYNLAEGSVDERKNNIFLPTIKLKLLSQVSTQDLVNDPDILNKLEKDWIKRHKTYVGNPEVTNHTYACNATIGGDGAVTRAVFSPTDANKIRKAAVKANIGEKSLSDEYEFILAACKHYNLPKPTLKNINDNVVLKILRNTVHGGSYYKVDKSDLENCFTPDEISYFDRYGGAWTDSSKSINQKKSAKYKIDHAEVWDKSVEKVLETFDLSDASNLDSCEEKIRIWLANNIDPTGRSSTWIQSTISDLKKSFRKCQELNIDKFTYAVKYPWKGTVIINEPIDLDYLWDHNKYDQYFAESYDISEAFNDRYFNNLDISRALDNKDYCIDLIRDFYGYDGPIETGGFYIMPDGTAVKSANHLDIDNLLIRYKYIKNLGNEYGKTLDYGDGSQFMDAINCVRIRRRGGKDSWILPYMILPEKQLTSAQYAVIENWAKFVMEKSHELNVQTLDNQSKVFKSSQHTYFDVIDAIKLYYRAHILEDLREDYEMIFDEE